MKRLVLVVLLALGAGGCMSADVNLSARQLVSALDELEAATVPDPRYDANGRLKVSELRQAVRRHAAAIEAATR